jgi:CRISPR-associated protein Cas1
MEKRINLFVTEQGAKLQVEGQRLFVSKCKEKLADIPLIHLRHIVIFGSATLTPRAVSRLLREGVFVSFLTMNGRFIGELLPAEHADGLIRKLQVKRLDDELFRIQISREIVTAKIHNFLWLLDKKRRKKMDLEKEKGELKKIEERVTSVSSMKELLGLEGSASRMYFSLISRIFALEFSFDGRKKHPAPDPLNALLSLSYTLLYSICFSFLHVVGLDPFIGFYHELRRGHASLASDLMEEFRAFVCDLFVLRIVNQGYFSPDSFTYTGDRVFLKKDSLKVFLKEWAKNLDRRVKVNDSFEADIWHLIELQAQKLKRAICGVENYIAFRAGE